MGIEKVSMINNGNSNLNVFDHINTFLDKKGIKSKNTRDSYERDIKQFFKFTRNISSLRDIKEHHLHFHKTEVENYQIHLMKSGMKANTVDRKISSLKSLYNSLVDYDYDVNPNWFKLENQSDENNELDTWGVLDWNEVEEMMELAKGLKRGYEKALLIEIAVMTSFRIDSLFKLKWCDLVKRDGVWTLHTIGKGKKLDIKAIRDEIYDKLIDLKYKKGASDKDHIFHICQNSNSTIEANKKEANRMIQKLADMMGIEKSRNIVFHSLKKTGMQEVNMITGGDIKAIQQQGNHSDESTSLKFYMQMEKDYSKLPSLEIGKSFDVSPLEELSKDQLLDLIMNSDRSVQIKLIQQLQNDKK